MSGSGASAAGRGAGAGERPAFRRLLVLGGAGFIGSHLLDRLRALNREGAGVEVRAWDLQTRKIEHLLDLPFLTFRRAGVDEPARRAELEADVAWSDAVLNLAAVCNPARYNTEPIETIRANFLDSQHLVPMAARLGKPFLFFSTSEVYGRTLASHVRERTSTDHAREHTPADHARERASGEARGRAGLDLDHPGLVMLDAATTPLVMGPVAASRWTYACAKQLYERWIHAHHAEQGLTYAIVRPFNFFGPRMDYLPGLEGEGRPRVLPIFVANLLLGQPLQLVDGGRARRTITSINDATDALIAILARPEAGWNRIHNVGNPNNEVSMAELARACRAAMARASGDASFLDHPIEDVASAEFYGPGYEDCDRRIMDVTPERESLGWEPRVGLEELLDETCRHYWALYGDRRQRRGA